MSRSLAALLSTYEIQVRRFVDAESFLQAIDPQPVDNTCLLIELDLPGTRGTTLLRQLRKKYEYLPIIAMRDGVPVDIAKQARDADATDFIEKSLIAAYLFHRIANLIPCANKLPHTAPSIMEMEDGKQVTFRMTHPEDAELQQSFVTALSDRSRYMRFFQA